MNDRKRLISLFLAVMLVAFTMAGSLFSVAYASSSGPEKKLTFTEKKTGIKARSVYNYSGYGIVNIPDSLEPGGTDRDWYSYGLIGPDGKYIIQPKRAEWYVKYDTWTNDFIISDGVICDMGKGYYNLDGSPLFDVDRLRANAEGDVSAMDQRILPYYNGQAAVMFVVYRNVGGQSLTVVPLYKIDKKGSIVKQTERVSEEYTVPYYWGGEGFMYMTDQQSSMVFYDYDGNVKIDLTGKGYDPYTGLFFSGYAWVRNAATNLCGFIDTSGKEVIPCMYEEVGVFADGLVSAKKDGKYGYINAQNEVVIPFEYDGAYGAGGGLVCVGKDGKYGFADLGNNIVLDYTYDDLSSFMGDVAYGIKDGEVYVIKSSEAESSGFPVIPVAAGTAGVAAVGIIAFAVIKHAGAAAAATAAASAAGASGAAAAVKDAAKGASKAAKEASKAGPKLPKIKFGNRTVLVSSEDEKLIDSLKSKTFLKVRICAEGEIAKAFEAAEADLLIADVASDDRLDKLLNTESLKGKALGLILSDAVSNTAREKLDELGKGEVPVNYIGIGESPFLALVDLVLPVLAPDVTSDASLSNISSVADALGIPGISSVIELFTAGRDIKENLQKDEEDIGISETADIIGDIASILGLDKLKDVAGLVGDVKAVKASLESGAGAYETKKGVKAAKSIIDTVTKQ